MTEKTKKELEEELARYKKRAAEEEQQKLVAQLQVNWSERLQLIREIQQKFPDLYHQLQQNGKTA